MDHLQTASCKQINQPPNYWISLLRISPHSMMYMISMIEKVGYMAHLFLSVNTKSCYCSLHFEASSNFNC